MIRGRRGPTDRRLAPGRGLPRLIQALDGDSDPWEFDLQARKKPRSFSFISLALGHRTWVSGFAMWNRDLFRGTLLLREGAEIRVTATPSLYRASVWSADLKRPNVAVLVLAGRAMMTWPSF